MQKFYWLFFIPFLFISLTGLADIVQASNQAVINFFYSETCPYCHTESRFLDELQEKYGDQLLINRYSVTKRANLSILKDLAEQYGAEKDAGFVPLTFIGEK